MKNYRGGDKVKAGFYINRKDWKIVTVTGKKGGILWGRNDDSFYRIPAPLMLVAGPCLGALFVIFLPVVGFVMFGSTVVKKVRSFQVKDFVKIFS